jgi:hypothetical protein
VFWIDAAGRIWAYSLLNERTLTVRRFLTSGTMCDRLHRFSSSRRWFPSWQPLAKKTFKEEGGSGL